MPRIKNTNLDGTSPAKRMKKYAIGGYLNGASHEQGGIPIEAEGGEFIINRDSVNSSTLDILEYINEHGDLPMSDARNRRNK